MITTVETYRSAGKAARALGDSGAVCIAGGNRMIAAVNANRTPLRLVRTINPGLCQITAAADTIRLGASVTMAQIFASRDCAVLHEVARQIGGPQVRSMATCSPATPTGTSRLSSCHAVPALLWPDRRACGWSPIFCAIATDPPS